MVARILTQQWLVNTNVDLAAESVPAGDRHLKARALWFKELSADLLACGASEAEYRKFQFDQQRSLAHIESFFLTQKQKMRNTGLIGFPVYRAAFYFLGEF